MKEFDVLKKKIQKLCLEYNSLKNDNERILKEEGKLKEKLELVKEQSMSVKKTIHQNEVLRREKQEVKNRLKNLLDKLEKAL